jgi:hypothetical protein
VVETKRHGDAFDYYYSLGEGRGYPQVASKFTVSRTSVKLWSKNFNWKERVIQRDLENNKKVEEKTNNAIVNTKADYRAGIGKDLKSLELFRQRAEKLIADATELIENGQIKIKSVEDLDRVTSTLKKYHDLKKDYIKQDLELMGESADGKQIIIINDLTGDGDED